VGGGHALGRLHLFGDSFPAGIAAPSSRTTSTASGEQRPLRRRGSGFAAGRARLPGFGDPMHMGVLVRRTARFVATVRPRRVPHAQPAPADGPPLRGQLRRRPRPRSREAPTRSRRLQFHKNDWIVTRAASCRSAGRRPRAPRAARDVQIRARLRAGRAAPRDRAQRHGYSRRAGEPQGDGDEYVRAWGSASTRTARPSVATLSRSPEGPSPMVLARQRLPAHAPEGALPAPRGCGADGGRRGPR
jgi:hypothetical protein